ncbi:helix-turn-helix transcriptional regulator [Halomonas daqingensis]|uniref:Helix-turn-helix transcriptional regulator n=1 Tax=Billgrantia desiderata TaxID=52021 RepID=A0AAW4YR55_9GAMM|nr:helix-turn-helix transcriptional regulator [Halomonas desiderata]MCE8040744.1 helix-turn-helix transcriptional regulator [Halomonas desiderata]MCE8045319.1 helix-turn-helix transcriptional regulator [Halomonas desiderata]MCE8050744.1 helix-turn-helix transcriptional regulator [Halomonas desiderata]
MKRREPNPDEREAKLVEVVRQLLAEEINEGDALRILRRDVLGLSQDAYAKLVGISRRTLSDLERNRANITLDTMNRVYRPLGLKVGLLPRQPGMLERALS